MQRPAQAIAVALAFAAGWFSARPKSAAPPVELNGAYDAVTKLKGWTHCRSKSGCFTVDMPGAVWAKTVPEKTHWGILDRHGFHCKTGATYFMVDYVDPPEKEIHSWRDRRLVEGFIGNLTQAGYSLAYDRLVPLRAGYGREIRHEEPKSRVTMVMRVIANHHRLYCVTYEAPKVSADAAARDRFLRSFACF